MQPKVFFSWFAQEYDSNPKSKNWYIVAGFLIGVSSLVAFFFQNILFAVILIMSGVMFVWMSLRPPLEQEIIITDHGIIMGANMFLYRDFDHFWLNENEVGTKKLFLARANGIVTLIPVSDDVDPVELNDFLQTVLREEPIAEPMMEILLRKLGL